MEGLDEWLPPLRRYRNRLTDRAGNIVVGQASGLAADLPVSLSNIAKIEGNHGR